MVKRETVALDLDAIFAALSHPIRRAMLERLAGGDATVSELARRHGFSRPAILGHLPIPEGPGLPKKGPDGSVGRCPRAPAPPARPRGGLTPSPARGPARSA